MNTRKKIRYINQPKLSSIVADQKFNERRTALLPHIENMLTTDKLFSSRDISVEFAHTGVSSLVCFITTNTEKYVLKIPLSEKPIEGEALFLKTWETAGVSVPHIFREDVMGGHSYIIMSFIDAPVLSQLEKSDTERKDMYFSIGKTMKLMHEPKTKGFGYIVSGIPQYKTFDEWINGEDVQKRIKAVRELNLFTDEHGSLEKAISILSVYCTGAGATSYCHFDFGSGNILATDPLTVIDPFPLVNNGIIDIGRTIQLMATGNAAPEYIETIKKGYFGNTPIPTRELQAAIIMSACFKFPYWYKKGKLEEIKKTQAFLADNKHLL